MTEQELDSPAASVANSEAEAAAAANLLLRSEMMSGSTQQQKQQELVQANKPMIQQQQQQQQQQEWQIRPAALIPEPKEAITSQQLSALHVRFEALHAAQLLSQEDLFSLEDALADYSSLVAELLPRVVTVEVANHAIGEQFAVAAKLLKIVCAASVFGSDAAFARQLKRQFV